MNDHFIYFRNIAIDEGGVPYKVRSFQKSYIKGKPHPDCLEYYMAVDSKRYIVHILWEKPTYSNKFGRGKTMKNLIFRFVTHFTKYKNSKRDTIQPF